MGSSDVMQVLLRAEERPYGGPWDVWTSKKGEVVESEATTPMSIGNWLERPIGEWCAQNLGLSLEEASPVCGALDWMRATPDFWMTGDDRREGLECKVSYKSRIWKDGLPPYVWLQAVWCMAVTDEPVWNVGCFLPTSMKRESFVVERNPEVEGVVIEKAYAWWKRHIIEGEPPAIDGSQACSEGLVKMYPAVRVEKIREATMEEDSRLVELFKLSERIKADQLQKKELMNAICADIADAQGLKGSRCMVRWDERKGTTRLDSKALKAAHPEIWDDFSVTGQPSRSARMYPVKEIKK